MTYLTTYKIILDVLCMSFFIQANSQTSTMATEKNTGMMESNKKMQNFRFMIIIVVFPSLRVQT